MSLLGCVIIKFDFTVADLNFRHTHKSFHEFWLVSMTEIPTISEMALNVILLFCFCIQNDLHNNGCYKIKIAIS